MVATEKTFEDDNKKENEKGVKGCKYKKGKEKKKKKPTREEMNTKKLQDRRQSNKMTIVIPSLSIITLNRNGLNVSTKRQSD